MDRPANADVLFPVGELDIEDSLGLRGVFLVVLEPALAEPDAVEVQTDDVVDAGVHTDVSLFAVGPHVGVVNVDAGLILGVGDRKTALPGCKYRINLKVFSYSTEFGTSVNSLKYNIIFPLDFDKYIVNK